MTTTPTPFGDKTNGTIYKKEVHKLQHSFAVVKATGNVFVGQPVKLDPSDDGVILPLANNDNADLCIGFSVHDTDIDAYEAGRTPINSIKDTYSVKRATISMRAHAIIIGLADESGTGSPAVGVVPGPVKYSGYELDGTTFFPEKGRSKFKNVDLTDATDRLRMIGWALESGDEGDEIKIALCK